MRQPRQGRATSRAPQASVVLAKLAATRTYLALDTPEQFRPYARDVPGARFRLLRPCPAATYRRLYHDVGVHHYWRDRAAWTDAEIDSHVARPDVAVWEAMIGDESAGFFELGKHDDGAVEIVYFGLTPEFVGRGLGGAMLARAVSEAWKFGATRVWLHTCTLDSPHALPNYQARGFVPFKTEDYLQEIG